LGWAFPAPSSSLPLPVPLPDATVRDCVSDVTGAKESSYEGDRNERWGREKMLEQKEGTDVERVRRKLKTRIEKNISMHFMTTNL